MLLNYVPLVFFAVVTATLVVSGYATFRRRVRERHQIENRLHHVEKLVHPSACLTHLSDRVSSRLMERWYQENRIYHSPPTNYYDAAASRPASGGADAAAVDDFGADGLFPAPRVHA